VPPSALVALGDKKLLEGRKEKNFPTKSAADRERDEKNEQFVRGKRSN